MIGLPIMFGANVTTTVGDESPVGPEDQILVLRAEDVVLFESGIRARVLPETRATILSVLLQVYGYLAPAVRYPASICVVTGLAVPEFWGLPGDWLVTNWIGRANGGQERCASCSSPPHPPKKGGNRRSVEKRPRRVVPGPPLVEPGIVALQPLRDPVGWNTEIKRTAAACTPIAKYLQNIHSGSSAGFRLTCLRFWAMKKLLSAVSLMSAFLGVAAMPDTIATAHADPVAFAPDWPDHIRRTERTICAALAQGWSRRQIVSAAQNANNSDLTGMDVDRAGERADALIDAARYTDCPTLNAS